MVGSCAQAPAFAAQVEGEETWQGWLVVGDLEDGTVCCWGWRCLLGLGQDLQGLLPPLESGTSSGSPAGRTCF